MKAGSGSRDVVINKMIIASTCGASMGREAMKRDRKQWQAVPSSGSPSSAWVEKCRARHCQPPSAQCLKSLAAQADVVATVSPSTWPPAPPCSCATALDERAG